MNRKAFSLVEVLAAVTLIGVIVFLALPNIVQVKLDSERQLAIARAEALNMAMASFVQARGSSVASTAWSGAADDTARYAMLAPYLAYAPDSLGEYIPDGYTATFDEDLVPLKKVTLAEGGSAITY